MMENYVYRFLDGEDNVIYVGKTGNIKQRMIQHFTKGHLPAECYDAVASIFYAKIGSEFNAELVETALIQKYYPIYNTDKKYRADELDFRVRLPEFCWKEIYFERTASGIQMYDTPFPYIGRDLRQIESAYKAIEMNLNVIRFHPSEVMRCPALGSIEGICSKLEEIYLFAKKHLSLENCDFSEWVVGDIEDMKASHRIAFSISGSVLPVCFGELLKIGFIEYLGEDVFCLPILCKGTYKRLQEK